jgi:hypothetical protein
MVIYDWFAVCWIKYCIAMLSLSVRNRSPHLHVRQCLEFCSHVCVLTHMCIRRFFIYLFIHVFILDIKTFRLSCHVWRNWRLWKNCSFLRPVFCPQFYTENSRFLAALENNYWRSSCSLIEKILLFLNITSLSCISGVKTKIHPFLSPT